MNLIPPIVAHGIAGRADLPVPTSYFIVGAGLAVVLSFVLVAALWKEPRWQEPVAGRPIGQPLRLLGKVLQVFGLVVLAFVVLAGIINGNSADNILSPVVIWIYFWLVIPFISALVGNSWNWLNPWRTLSRWINRGVPERTDWGGIIGLWPAAEAFVAFTWLELVVRTNTEPRTLALVAIVYTLYVLAITRILGVETGLSSGEAFQNYNGLISEISPVAFERQPEGVGAQTVDIDAPPRLMWRGWLRSLPGVTIRPGLVALVVAMIGTVTYDGLSETNWWLSTFGSTASKEWFSTLGLLAIVVLVGAAYLLASAAAAKLGDSDLSALDVARSFAHTLVPIALAYAVAHYFTFIVFEGQQLLHELSDPFGSGWDLFGTADWSVNFWLSAESVWYVQVAAIVLGHVAGVVLAHDRALKVFRSDTAVRTQYAMLALMVGLTALGLGVLSG